MVIPQKKFPGKTKTNALCAACNDDIHVRTFQDPWPLNGQTVEPGISA
jgi:hypothetical protein